MALYENTLTDCICLVYLYCPILGSMLVYPHPGDTLKDTAGSHGPPYTFCIT